MYSFLIFSNVCLSSNRNLTEPLRAVFYHQKYNKTEIIGVRYAYMTRVRPLYGSVSQPIGREQLATNK